MAGLSPTQRTLRSMRELGRFVDTVERWIPNPRHPGGGFRKDFLGFVDLIALDPGFGIIAIQSCGQDFAAHLRKILDSECSEAVVEWLKCGGKLEVWGWRRIKLKRGGKAMRWRPRVQEITLEDFEL